MPLGTWNGLRLALHLSWIPILLVLAWMAQGPAGARGIAVTGALAGAAIHALVASLVLRQRGQRFDELMLTPYGIVPRWAGQPVKAPGSVWVSLVISGILVRLACAMMCHGGLAADGSSRSVTGSPWFVLQQWNLLLAWLHPLPAIPLDGSRALRAWVGFLLPPPLTNSILRRAGLTCAFLLLFWSLWGGDIHYPALLTALFLWHAAETATREQRDATDSGSSDSGWNPDEIVVSPPPYARNEKRDAATSTRDRRKLNEVARDFMANVWAGC